MRVEGGELACLGRGLDDMRAPRNCLVSDAKDGRDRDEITDELDLRAELLSSLPASPFLEVLARTSPPPGGRHSPGV